MNFVKALKQCKYIFVNVRLSRDHCEYVQVVKKDFIKVLKQTDPPSDEYWRFDEGDLYID